MRFVTVFTARLALPVLLLIALPLAASAQIEIRARASTITIGGRLHVQYAQSSVAGAVDDFFFRRARVTADIVINDFLDGKIEPDFAFGRALLQDTYFRLTFTPATRIAFGIFKRAYSIWDISSSTDLPTIERNAAIEGTDLCAGVGGICSLSQLTQELDLDGRDMGLRLEGTHGRLIYQGTLTNGTGNNNLDENDAKSFSGRMGVRIGERVTVSAFAGVHDALIDDEETLFFSAGGADIEFGTWREGVHVLAGVTGGENWLVEGFPQFLAAQLLASWYRPLGGARFVAFEPHLRVGWGDGDRSTADDAGLLVTPGFMFYISGRNGIAADLDYYTPQAADSEYSFKVQTFLYF